MSGRCLSNSLSIEKERESKGKTPIFMRLYTHLDRLSTTGLDILVSVAVSVFFSHVFSVSKSLREKDNARHIAIT